MISGTATKLTKAGAGTLTLSGANTYTGATTVSAGTLQIGAGGSTGSLGTGAVSVASGATLAFNRSDDLSSGVTITGAGNITKMGSNTLSFTNDFGASTDPATNFTGAINIDGGQLTLVAPVSGYNSFLGTAININNGSTLALTSVGGGNYRYDFRTNVNFDAGGGGAIRLLKKDVNWVAWGGTKFTTNGGLQNRVYSDAADSYGINVSGLEFSTAVGSQTGLGDLRIEVPLVNGGTITKTGAGSVVLANAAGNPAFTATQYAATNINGGSFVVGDGGANGRLGSGTVTVASGASLVFNRSDAITISNTITGAGNVQQLGSGTTTLSGSNAYTGSTRVSAGILKAGSSSAFGSNSAVTLDNVAGATLDITGYSVSIGSLAGGGLSGGNVILGSGTLTTGGDNSSTTYAGLISSTTGGGLTKAGTGTLTLTNDSTYNGTTLVSAGVLELGNGGTTGFLRNSSFQVGNAGLVVNHSGTYYWTQGVSQVASTTGTFDLKGTGTMIFTSGNIATSGTFTIHPGATLQLGEGGTAGSFNSTNVVLNGNIVYYVSDDRIISKTYSGTGNFSTIGTGIITLYGDSSYSGTTTIAVGATLRLGDEGLTRNNGTIGPGTTGSIGAGPILNNGTLIFRRSNALTQGNTITGTGRVIQQGSGTTTLTANSSYTGTTTISAGTLVFQNNAPTTASSKFSGPGKLHIEPSGTSFSSSFSTAGWNIDSVTLLTELTIGKTGNTAAITLANATTVNGPVNLLGGDLTLNGALTAQSSTITLASSGNVTHSASGWVSASNLLLSGGNVTLTSSNNAINTLAATGVSGLSYVNSKALTIGTVGSTSGISATGVVDVSTLIDDLSVIKAVSTTSTSASALTLNAGSQVNAGVFSGGNLQFSGDGAASVGSGGIARLYTGSIAGSTGLTSLTGLGSGSGRFRYGSDESTTSYTLALSAGLNAIYREQPSITRVVDDKTITYGDALPSFTFSVLGGGNGDSYSQAFGSASAPAVAVGGSTSTSGQYTAGVHTLSATGGSTSSQLGYAVNASTTSGKLLVNRKTLTLGFTGQNKIYDGTDSATVSVSDNRVSGDVLSISRSAVFTAGANAGTGKAIGVSDVLLSGADAANYSLSATTGSATANITPAALTVRANDDAKFVTLSDANGYAGVSYTGFVNGETALTAALTGTLAISRSNSSNNTAGSYSGVLVPSGLSSNNYSISYVRGDYTIVPANQLLVKVSNASTVYGTAANYSVTSAQYLGADNQMVTLNTVTVDANNQVTIQDGASGSATFTLAPLAAQWSTAQKLRVGSYQLGTSGTVTENSQNFSNTITVVGSHTVTAKGLNASASGTSKTYDGSAAMTGMTLALSTVEALDAVTVSGSGAYASKDVGTVNYTVSNVALSGADAGNYYLRSGNSLTGSGTISAKQLTLSASKIYDGTTSLVGAVTLGGLVGSETLSYTGATASNAHVATSGKYISAITLANGSNGGLASNYALPTLDAANAAVTITPKALVASASIVGATSKTYDGTTTATGASVSGSVVGAVDGDTLTLNTTGITLAYNNAHVADATSINATGSLVLNISSPTHGSQASDYSFTSPTIASVAARITPAVLSASLSNTGVTKTYDGSTAAPVGFTPSWNVTGFVTGDTAASLTPSTTAYNSKNVTQATLLTLSGLSITGITGTRSSAPSDYVLSSSSSSVSAQITAKTLTITGFQAADKTYDGTTYATVTDWGRVVTGVGSETLALNHGSAVFNDANAGSRTVTASNYTLVNGSNGGLASNYVLSSNNTSASATIHKALLTITANDDAKFITTSDVAGYAGVSYSGFVSGESTAQLSALPSVARDLTVLNTDNNANVQSAGIYQNALKATGASAANYDFSYVPGNFTIVPANQLLVRVNNASTIYGTTAAYSLASASYAYFDNANVLQVVTLSDSSINGSNLVTVNDGAGGRATFTLAPRNPSLSSAQLLRVGSYQLATSGTVTENSANFSDTITVVGALTVTPKPLLAATNSGVSKTYDGTTTMNGVTFTLTGQGGSTGVETDDRVTVSGNGAYANKNAGTNLVYTVNNLTLDGVDAGNYYISSGRSFSGGNGTITAKALTLSAVSDTKFFDGSTRSGRTPEAVGLVSGDSFSSLLQAFDSSAVGLRRLIVSYTIDDGNDGNNYAVTLRQANGAIQASDAPLPPTRGPGGGGHGGSGGESGGGTPGGRSGPEGAREGGGAASARGGQPINTQLPTEPPGAHSTNVRVILVHDAAPREQGLTRVYVPREALGVETGFSFLVALPPTDEVATASLRDGSALPGWLAFDGRALRFTARKVPSNGLPLLVRVQRGPLVMEVDLFESTHP